MRGEGGLSRRAPLELMEEENKMDETEGGIRIGCEFCISYKTRNIYIHTHTHTHVHRVLLASRDY